MATLHLPGWPVRATLIPSPSVGLGGWVRGLEVGVNWEKEWWGVYTKSHPESAS